MAQNNKKEKANRKDSNGGKKEKLSEYKLSFIGHILTFAGLIFTFVGLIIGIVQYNTNYEQQKKANTIAYLQSLHELVDNTDESLLEIIKYYDITNDSVSMISLDSLEKILKENHTYRKQLNDLYIGFNQLAIGCREGFFEEKIAWIANASMISRVTKALIPYYELIEKENKLKGYGKFLRIMVFRWEHANPFIDEFEKKIDQFQEEVTRATNVNTPYIRRMSDVNE